MRRFLWLVCVCVLGACGGGSSPSSPDTPGPTDRIGSDRELFDYISTVEPRSQYAAFPNVGTIASGSSAHRPFVRVSLNRVALGALQDGRLPRGSSFPDGSVIVKDVLTAAGETTTYAVMFKDSANRYAAGGWLWAELNPNGTTGYSITNRGSACTSCHSLDRGRENDLVRTFERQPQ